MKSLYEAMTTQLHSYNYKYLREYYIYKYHEYHVFTILDVFGVSVHQLNPIFFGGPTSFHRRDRQVPWPIFCSDGNLGHLHDPEELKLDGMVHLVHDVGNGLPSGYD